MPQLKRRFYALWGVLVGTAIWFAFDGVVHDGWAEVGHRFFHAFTLYCTARYLGRLLADWHDERARARDAARRLGGAHE